MLFLLFFFLLIVSVFTCSAEKYAGLVGLEPGLRGKSFIVQVIKIILRTLVRTTIKFLALDFLSVSHRIP